MAQITTNTDTQLRKALSPIKSFLTRHSIDHSEVFPS